MRRKRGVHNCSFFLFVSPSEKKKGKQNEQRAGGEMEALCFLKTVFLFFVLKLFCRRNVLLLFVVEMKHFTKRERERRRKVDRGIER